MEVFFPFISNDHQKHDASVSLYFTMIKCTRYVLVVRVHVNYFEGLMCPPAIVMLSFIHLIH